MPETPALSTLGPSRWADLTKPETLADPRQESVRGDDVSKDMFLKLIVAQLRNQNPMNPMDGVDFLTQLSQITGVEQMVTMRQELASIHALLRDSAAAAAGSPTAEPPVNP